MALLVAFSMANVVNILYVALGLGLVIFIHELGHFAVAKWCGVKVERFSIGFGPVLWKFTRGETEYALSAIPFGGYVKMLGQDDADPSQMADTRIARDPRSYTSKPVHQRMAIISAGVINNMVSAVLFFIIAFMLGVQYQPAVVGQVVPGMPAWKAGLRLGDRITRIGDREDQYLGFVAVKQAVALSDGALPVEGLRDGQPFSVLVEPMMDDKFPTIGVEGENSLQLLDVEEVSPTVPGTPASQASPPFASGDEIVEFDGVPLESYAQFQKTLAAKRSKEVVLGVRRKGASGDVLTKITVPPNRFRTLGLRMDIGKISAVQEGSPASKVDLKVGDKITHIVSQEGDRSVGIDLDPLELPDFFAGLHGQDVTIRVKREVAGADSKIHEVTLRPDDRPGWIERPVGPDAPISVPSVGICFHVLHHVLKVEPGSPADGKIRENDNIQKLEFVNAPGEKDDTDGFKPILFSELNRNWPQAFTMMQVYPKMNVKVTVKAQGSKEERVEELTPQVDENWFLPVRGFRMETLMLTRQAENMGEAVTLGFRSARDSLIDMWLTIRRLTSGRISPKALGGPITIARVAYHFSNQGIPDLLLFLGLLSVSLAVLNFMPIPVLDGGHFVFLAWEGLRGKPPSERIVIAANYVGLLMVLSLMLWVLWMDISTLPFWRN